jgi:subtilisin family serine protease
MRSIIVFLVAGATALPLASAEIHRVSPKVRVYLSCPQMHRQPDRAPDKLVAPVLIRFRSVPNKAQLSALSRHGVELLRSGESPLHLGPLFPARVTRRGVEALARSPLVRRVELSALLRDVTPLTHTIPEIRAPTAWPKEVNGVPLTGKGVTIGNIDSGVDLFHPAFFRPDGGLYAWIDADGDKTFTPGKDAVDLDGDGKAGKGETLELLDSRSWVRAWAKKILTSGEGAYQTHEDWLYADANDNKKRDFGPDGGFDDSAAAFGEPLFVAEDLDGDGVLDPEEKLRRLKSSKVKAVWLNDKAYPLGQDMTKFQIAETSHHGTGTSGIMIAGQRGFTARTGAAPGADLMLATTPYGGKTPLSAAVIWLAQSKVDVMLHEYAPWTGYHLDGSSNHETLMDQAAQLGIPQVTPAGNLGSTAKHLRTPLDAGSTLTTKMTVPTLSTGDISSLHLTLLWRDPSAKLAFNIVAPGGQGVDLPEDNTGGKPWPDGKSFYYSYRSDSKRGTAMMDVYLYGGTLSTPAMLPKGYWTLTVKHPGVSNSLVLYGYVSDNVSGWGNGAAFHNVSEKGLICFPATADSAITVAAYTGHAGDPYDIFNTGNKSGELREYSGRGERIDGTEIMDVAAPDNPLTPINSTMSFAGQADYQLFGGTSGAGPHVAGAAALLKQLEPTLSGVAVRDRLRKGALADKDVGTVPSETWGMGKLRVFRTLYGKDPVANTAPTAKIKVGPAYVDEPVTFEPEVKDAEDVESALQIRWDEDYDDNWSQYGPVATLKRTYQKQGWVRLKLEVKDSGGLTGAAAVLLEVVPKPTPDGGVPDGGGDDGGSGNPDAQSDAGGGGGGAKDDGCRCRLDQDARIRVPWSLVFLALFVLLFRRRAGH